MARPLSSALAGLALLLPPCCAATAAPLPPHPTHAPPKSGCPLQPPGDVDVPCLEIPHCSGPPAVVSNFTVMGEHAGLPPKPIEPEPTSASICYTDEGLQVDWKAVDKHVVYNCSGSYTECCHDQVWMRDALEFYIAPGLNASWDPSVGDFGAHNVTEVDGGPMGGFWAGYMNNSGYNPTQPSILIDCRVPGLSWKPRITSDGFAAHLRVPWHMLPGGKPEVLKGSVWRLNFYRWDHGLDPHDVTVGNASAWSVTYCDFGEKGAHGEGCNPEHIPKYFGVGVLQ